MSSWNQWGHRSFINKVFQIEGRFVSRLQALSLKLRRKYLFYAHTTEKGTQREQQIFSFKENKVIPSFHPNLLIQNVSNIQETSKNHNRFSGIQNLKCSAVFGKESYFQALSIGSNNSMSVVGKSHNNARKVDNLPIFRQNLIQKSSLDEKNRILKKILTQFNVKTHQIEHKKFMNIFGLEIKQIPPQDLQKSLHKYESNQIQAYQKKPQKGNMNEINKYFENESHIKGLEESLINAENFSRLENSSSNNLKQQDEQKGSDMISSYNFKIKQLWSNSNIKNRIVQQNSTQGTTNSIGISPADTQKVCRSISSDANAPKNDDNSRQDEAINNDFQLNNGQDLQLSDLVVPEKKRLSTNHINASAGMRRVQNKSNSNVNNTANFKFSINDSNMSKEEVFFKKLNSYKDFIFKINLGSQIFIPFPKENPTYKLCIGRGNNKQLILNCIKARWWWTVVEYDTNKLDCNFLWTQLKQNDFYEKQNKNEIQSGEQSEKQQGDNNQITEKQLIPSSNFHHPQLSTHPHHHHNNKLVSRAKVVFKQIQQQFPPKQINNTEGTTVQSPIYSPPEKRLGNKVTISKDNKASISQQPSDHNSKIFHSEDLVVYQKYMNGKIGQKDYEQQNWDDLQPRLKYLKRPHAPEPKKIEQNGKMMVHNHLQFNFHLGNKKALFYNMRQYYQLLHDDVFHYLPLTFHLTKGVSDKEYKFFLKKYREIEKNNQELDNDDDSKPLKIPKNVWIVKPGEITNRGNGIQVCDNLQDIKRILLSRDKHSNGKEKTYIVQKYIDRPLLYNRRKFDIRAYMMVTSINGIIRAYWYQEGYIRTSGREFDLSDVGDVFIHLTNDAIQKDCEEYNKFEPGNKLSYFEFQRYLDIWYPDAKWNIFTQIVPKMKAIATDAIRATFLKLDLNQKERPNNFEVFGLDFMIDEKFQLYLIEINTNPAIETTCPICMRVIPNMIENALRIGLDPLFPPPTAWPTQKKHSAPDSLTEHNRFEIIFDEYFEGPDLKKLYSNQGNCLEGINDLDEDEEIIEDSQKDKVTLQYE